MWIVKLALRRPYTFVAVALLMLIIGIWFMFTTRKDIFPDINIPVVSVIWSYAGLPAQEFDQRITTFSEYALSNNVNDIEHMESQTYNGVSVIRLYFHPSVEIQSAVAQATATSQSILRRMPLGVQPPSILRYSANSVPIIQILLSSDNLTEQQLYDYGIYRIRQQIAVIQGTTLPLPYGGKVRQVMVDLDPVALQAKGLSPRDVNQAVNDQVLTQPTGDVKIGNMDYRIDTNSNPDLIAAMNDMPIKVVDGVIVYLRDVGFAHDGFIPQTNIVRNEGKRSVLLTLLKNGPASTLTIINNLKNMLPTMRAAAPEGMHIDLLFDQSIFVRAAINSVLIAGFLAAMLTGMMILIFLGSWRSTIIVLISIPLSILTSIIFLGLIGETLNVMTLGGLALAIGILVDDATVTIENIHRNRLTKPLHQAVLDGSYQIAIPAFVSTLSICIVFTPVMLLVGPSRYLFIPFALAVVFAIATSYFLSRTLVPVMIQFMLDKEAPNRKREGFFDRYQAYFDRRFHRFRARYALAINWSMHHRMTIVTLFGIIFLSGMLIFPFIGSDFFPLVDAGQFRLHVKAPSGTRLEVTEGIFGAVEDEIRNVIPNEDLSKMIDNIGLVGPSSSYNLGFGDNATIGSYDGEILVSLNNNKKMSTPEYIKKVRKHLKEKFPDLEFYFQPADMVQQILNFGLPTPIDIRVIGYNKAENLKIAKELIERISKLPGAIDVHLHQVVDAPQLFFDMDRTLLAKTGLTQHDVMNDVLITYSDSTAVTPNFWLDRKAGIPYFITVQTPKYRINTMDELLRTPISSPQTKESQLLSNLVTVKRQKGVDITNHYNIQPVYDIYANVEGRDLGGLANDIQKIIDEYNKKMAPGNTIELKGMVENMQNAFERLRIGFIFAIILIYLIMVINFQSWLDPLIIIMAIPGALAGIAWILFLTHTTFNVPSMMGVIMSMGVATANSILVVTFANMQLKEGRDSIHAMVASGCTRLRPVLMTALAMIVGMIPMALGIGEGGEQNQPLGIAVIGGLTMATFTTLFFVPVIFTYLRKTPNPYLYDQPEQYKPPEHMELSEENERYS